MADEDFRERLRRLMKGRGFNPRSLSLAAGLNHTAVRDILEGRSRSPQYSTIRKLAGALECDIRELVKHYELEDAQRKAAKPRALESVREATVTTRVLEARRIQLQRELTGVEKRIIDAYAADLPVRGKPREDKAEGVILDEEVTSFVYRPRSLVGVDKAFATYMYGSTMEPRFFSEELLFIHPSAETRAGSFVLVEMQAGFAAVVRQMVGVQGMAYTVRQLNPPLEETISYASMAGIYRIIGSLDGRFIY